MENHTLSQRVPCENDEGPVPEWQDEVSLNELTSSIKGLRLSQDEELHAITGGIGNLSLTKSDLVGALNTENEEEVVVKGRVINYDGLTSRGPTERSLVYTVDDEDEGIVVRADEGSSRLKSKGPPGIPRLSEDQSNQIDSLVARLARQVSPSLTKPGTKRSSTGATGQFLKGVRPNTYGAEVQSIQQMSGGIMSFAAKKTGIKTGQPTVARNMQQIELGPDHESCQQTQTPVSQLVEQVHGINEMLTQIGIEPDEMLPSFDEEELARNTDAILTTLGASKDQLHWNSFPLNQQPNFFAENMNQTTMSTPIRKHHPSESSVDSVIPPPTPESGYGTSSPPNSPKSEISASLDDILPEDIANIVLDMESESLRFDSKQGTILTKEYSYSSSQYPMEASLHYDSPQVSQPMSIPPIFPSSNQQNTIFEPNSNPAHKSVQPNVHFQQNVPSQQLVQMPQPQIQSEVQQRMQQNVVQLEPNVQLGQFPQVQQNLPLQQNINFQQSGIAQNQNICFTAKNETPCRKGPGRPPKEKNTKPVYQPIRERKILPKQIVAKTDSLGSHMPLITNTWAPQTNVMQTTVVYSQTPKMSPATTYPKIAPKESSSSPKPEGAIPRKNLQDILNDSKLKTRAARQIAGRHLQEILTPDDEGDTLLHAYILNISEDPRAVYIVHAILNRLKRAHEDGTIQMKRAVNATNQIQQTPVYLATIVNQPVVLDWLLKLGGDANHLAISITHSEQKRKGPLHFAASRGDEYYDVLCVLLDNKEINLNLQNSDGLTPLHVAGQEHGKLAPGCDTPVNSQRVIQALISKGADLDCGDGKSGKTPIHYIIETQDYKLIKAVFDVIPDAQLKNYLRKPTYDQNTALHIAAQLVMSEVEEHIEIIKLLLERGADPSLKNLGSETAGQIAYKQNRDKLSALLKPSHNRNMLAVQPPVTSCNQPTTFQGQGGSAPATFILVQVPSPEAPTLQTQAQNVVTVQAAPTLVALAPAGVLTTTNGKVVTQPSGILSSSIIAPSTQSTTSPIARSTILPEQTVRQNVSILPKPVTTQIITSDYQMPIGSPIMANSPPMLHTPIMSPASQGVTYIPQTSPVTLASTPLSTTLPSANTFLEAFSNHSLGIYNN